MINKKLSVLDYLAQILNAVLVLPSSNVLDNIPLAIAELILKDILNRLNLKFFVVSPADLSLVHLHFVKLYIVLKIVP